MNKLSLSYEPNRFKELGGLAGEVRTGLRMQRVLMHAGFALLLLVGASLAQLAMAQGNGSTANNGVNGVFDPGQSAADQLRALGNLQRVLSRIEMNAGEITMATRDNGALQDITNDLLTVVINGTSITAQATRELRDGSSGVSRMHTKEELPIAGNNGRNYLGNDIDNATLNAMQQNGSSEYVRKFRPSNTPVTRLGGFADGVASVEAQSGAISERLRIAQEAYKKAAERFQSLDNLRLEIGNAITPKAIQDLQARIQVEQVMMQNEQIKIATANQALEAVKDQQAMYNSYLRQHSTRGGLPTRSNTTPRINVTFN